MRWIKRGALMVLGFVLVMLAVVYGGSEWVIRKGHAVPEVPVAIPSDAASIAEGGRIARIASCRECHGADGQGKILFEAPVLGRIAPPSLARIAAERSDAELARAIRHGVRADGSSLFIMPTHALGRIADDDLARIIAWIRSLQPGPQDSTATMAFSPMGRALILAGKLPAMASPAQLAEPRRPADTGRYFVGLGCAACHKLHQDGVMEDGKTWVPALAPLAAAYDPAKFRTLLRTGVGSKPDHGIMSVVARESFRYLKDDEIAAVQSYLTMQAHKAAAQ